MKNYAIVFWSRDSRKVKNDHYKRQQRIGYQPQVQRDLSAREMRNPVCNGASGGGCYIMQILRGILLTVGIGLVCLAACATEWEPVPILLMGGTGLALCGIAGGIKKAAGRAGTRRGGRAQRKI